MKKLLSLALAFALCLGLAVPALAAEGETQRGILTYTESIAPQYEDVHEFSYGLAAVKKDGKWGYIDADNNVVIDFQYDYAWDFNEGYAIVAKAVPDYVPEEDDENFTFSYDLDCYIGFIDLDNNYTPFIYSMAPTYDEQTGAFSYTSCPLILSFYEYTFDNDYVDSEGNLQHEHNEYSRLPDSEYWIFHNGLARISSDIYDTSGAQIVFTSSDDDHHWFVVRGPANEGLIPIRDEGMYYLAGFADADGNFVKLFELEYFGPEIEKTEGEGEWVETWTDQSHRWVYHVSSFNQGLAIAWQATYDAETETETDEFGFIDRNYNWVIQPQYSRGWHSNGYTTQENFGETGLAIVGNADGMYGAIDKTGNVVIPFEYDNLLPVDYGLMAFESDGKWGYLNAADLSVAIPAQYEKASSFNGFGLAVVYDGQKAFIIDRSGQSVPGADKLNPSTYFSADGGVSSPDTYVVIEENGKYGFGRIDYLPNLPDPSEMDGWAYAEVVAAIEENLVPTYLQNLYLNNITRNEFCDLIMQALEEVLNKDMEIIVKEKTGKDLVSLIQSYPFQDTSSSTVVAANALGIVNGRGGGIFDPYASITRQEAAALLMRAAGVLGMDTSNIQVTSFADSGDVGVWFTDAVNFVCQIGVMNGTGNEQFTPTGSYTREQSYVTIYRLFQAVMKQVEG